MYFLTTLPAAPTAWSLEDYLEAEPGREIRHKYVAGSIYPKEGGSEEHNFIAGNLAVAMRGDLRGKPCKMSIHDMKAHVFANLTLFHYPDVMVVCDPTHEECYYKTIGFSLPLAEVYEGVFPKP